MRQAEAIHPCRRVLVVDDNDDMLATMREVLELRGMEVVTSTSSSDADRILGNGFEPNVIVLDLLLGDGERGDAYARRLRANPCAVKVPIVIMSGANSLDAQIDPEVVTLAKPFDIDKLYELLSDVCAGKR